MKKSLVSLASVFVLSALSLPANANTIAATPDALVSMAAERMSDRDRTQIADSVLASLDVEAIASFTLGLHGARLDAATKKEFASAFERFLRRQIESNSDAFEGVELSLVKTDFRDARDAIVTTRVKGQADTFTLRWRVIERAGQWAVVDLEFAGIWLAIEQRAQVSAILDRPGADIDDVIATFG